MIKKVKDWKDDNLCPICKENKEFTEYDPEEIVKFYKQGVLCEKHTEKIESQNFTLKLKDETWHLKTDSKVIPIYDYLKKCNSFKLIELTESDIPNYLAITIEFSGKTKVVINESIEVLYDEVISEELEMRILKRILEKLPEQNGNS